MVRWIFPVLVGLTGTAHAQTDAGEAMLNALTQTCLAKVQDEGPVALTGMTRADPKVEDVFVPDGGSVWYAANSEVMVINPDTDYACQVLGSDIAPDRFSDLLSAWLEDSGFRMEGRLPIRPSDPRGVYFYGRAADGGYVQIHVSPMPQDRVGALVTRSFSNDKARRLLGR